MRNNLLLAAGTGLLSAILLMIAASGSLTVTLLAYLTPLPLLILGLSGKNYAGVAGAVAALVLFLVTTPLVAIIYFFLVALPVTLFCDNATQMPPRPSSHQGVPATLPSTSAGHLCALISAIPAVLLTILFHHKIKNWQMKYSIKMGSY